MLHAENFELRKSRQGDWVDMITTILDHSLYY